jgi:SAM-dependent methyltransferase
VAAIATVPYAHSSPGAALDEDLAMGRFASTAELYEQFRPPYPAEFFRAVAERLQLSKQHGLIDLGTGPGLLAIGFAPYVGHVTAVDPEPAMLAVARRAIARAGHAVLLIEGRAEDLPADIGSFDVVTIGRALHWMDRRGLGPMFERLVKPEGVIVVCASFSAPGERNAWLDEYNTARRDWSDESLWSESRQGERAHRDLAAALEGTGFHAGEKIRVEATHQVSVSDLAQRVLTFSSSSPAALGDRVDAMLADIEARLSPFGRDGLLTETLLSAAQIVRR